MFFFTSFTAIFTRTKLCIRTAFTLYRFICNIITCTIINSMHTINTIFRKTVRRLARTIKVASKINIHRTITNAGTEIMQNVAEVAVR